MSFLGRIAARASAKAATAGAARSSPVASESTPAMASGSPLVRFDQRLTLPRFSEFGVSPAPDASTGELDEADGLSAPPGEGTTHAGDPRAASVLAEQSLPSEDVPARAFPVSPMAETSLRAPRVNLEPATSAARAVAPSLATLVDSQPLASGVADVVPDVQAPQWSGDSSTQQVTEVSVGKQEAAAGNAAVSNAAVSNAAVGNAPLELTPNRAVLDTIARLNAWMRTEEREIEGGAFEESPGHASTALPAPSVAAVLPEAPARDAEDTGFSAAPMISIGRLEIEVVPPAPRERTSLSQPAPQRRQASAPRSAPSAASGERRSFGWRQR